MVFNYIITETVNTTIVTEKDLISKQQTFSSRPKC